MPRLQDVLASAARHLRDAGVATPDFDARRLLEAATGFDHAALLAHGGDEIEASALAVYHSLIERRVEREPVGRILGWREFWGLRFRLSPATLEPRPDTETLVEAVLEQIPDRARPLRVCDLGTGTGCLLAALLHEYPVAQGVGIDCSADALATAEANLAALGLGHRARFAQGDWAEGLEGTFDVVVSNPPYIREDEDLSAEVRRFDPARALFAGQDGLEAYRALLPALPRLLTPDGLTVLELGIGQSATVQKLAAENGLVAVCVRPDLAGIPRALVLKL